jgi:hypothetical protein
VRVLYDTLVRTAVLSVKPDPMATFLGRKLSGSYLGFNFFDNDDQKLFRTIACGEFNISGFQKKNLRRHLPGWDTAKVCRILKTLRVHGLIKKIGSTYKYYLTHLGRQVVAAGLKLKTLFLVPELSATPLHCRS